MSMKVSPRREPPDASVDAPPAPPPALENAPGRAIAAPTGRAPKRFARPAAVAALIVALAVIVVGSVDFGATSRRSVSLPPATSAAAVTCKIGFYVESLHDDNVTAGTFSADLWAWSVCPKASLKPLETIEFTNADSMQKSFASTTAEANGSEYSSMRFSAQFRHAYELTAYPFDRQRFSIQFEDSGSDSTQLAYRPDVANTACAPRLALDDWNVSTCSLTIDRHAYDTNFGDPEVAANAVHSYDRGTLVISAARSHSVTEYLKSTSIIYPSVLLIIISFFLMTEATNTLGARMSTSGGALFSVALSMKALSSQLNADNRLTLMDALGLLALVCVVFAGGTALWCQRRLDDGVEFETVRTASHRLGWSTLAIFLAVNALLVVLAVR